MTDLLNDFNSTRHRVTLMGDAWIVVGTDDHAPETWLKERGYEVTHAQWTDRRQSSEYLTLDGGGER